MRNLIEMTAMNASKKANLLTLTKQVSNKERNFRAQIVATKENTLEKLSGQKVWPSDGYFKSQVTDYNMEKVSYLENALFYVIQAFLTAQKSKKMYYGNHFVLGQVIEAANIPKDIDAYECATNEVKIYRPEYGTTTGQFLGLHEAVVSGDDDETFFIYGYDKEKSKVLHSYQKKRNPNSFNSMLFNRHKDMIENGELAGEFSNLFFFLPSITDRSEDVNQYLNNINITPIDDTQIAFQQC